MPETEKVPDGMKQCSKCGEVKSATAESFYRNKWMDDGLTRDCRVCRKKYVEANREKILEKDKKYREANKDKIQEKDKKYYEANKDKFQEKDKKYYEANKDKTQERQKKYREANKDKIQEKDKKHYEANKGEVLERQKKYYEANKGEVLERQKKYNEAKRKEHTEALNAFYRANEIPEYLWHEDEFAYEKDFQKAIEWVVVSRLGFDIEHEVHLEEQGRVDTYIPELDLIIEVKLLSPMWVSYKEEVKEQARRYQEISSTVIVSLDGEPDWWADDEISAVMPWMNPEELFGFLAEIIADS